MSDSELVDLIAKRMWFESCDYDGWPNGRPAWDEMDGTKRGSKDEFRKMARAAIEVMRSITEVLPDNSKTL